jgi:hypothetical protein
MSRSDKCRNCGKGLVYQPEFCSDECEREHSEFMKRIGISEKDPVDKIPTTRVSSDK